MAAETGRRQGRPGEKSNFAVACTLLSQYIKAKGGGVDLGLGVGSENLLVPKGGSFLLRSEPLVDFSIFRSILPFVP